MPLGLWVHRLCLIILEIFLMFYLQVEGQNDESREILQKAAPDRIGHGTFLHSSIGGDQDLEDMVIEKRIPLGTISLNLNNL